MMPSYNFDPAYVGPHIAKIQDEDVRTAIGILAVMMYDRTTPDFTLTDALAVFNHSGVDAGKVLLPPIG
jgi:hypothetical protein